MSAATTRRPLRGQRFGSLGSVLPVSLIEPDGLIITTDGRYVRLLECERIPNAISADQTQLAVLERAYRELCRAIPDGQSLAIYSQTDTLADVREALAEDRDRVAAACDHDLARGQERLALARRRLLAGLTQTVLRAAGAEQPGVAARWWVAVPTAREPARPATSCAKPPPAPGEKPPGRRITTPPSTASRWRPRSRPRSRAPASTPTPLTVSAAWRSCGSVCTPRRGPCPTSPSWRPSPGSLSSHPTEQARQLRHDTLRALCDTAGADAPVAGLDASDPGWLRHADGTLEEVLHLATPPLRPAVVAVTCWPARCRQRSPSTSPSGRAPASMAANAAVGSGCGGGPLQGAPRAAGRPDEHDALDGGGAGRRESWPRRSARPSTRSAVYARCRDPARRRQRVRQASSADTAREFHASRTRG